MGARTAERPAAGAIRSAARREVVRDIPRGPRDGRGRSNHAQSRREQGMESARPDRGRRILAAPPEPGIQLAGLAGPAVKLKIAPGRNGLRLTTSRTSAAPAGLGGNRLSFRKTQATEALPPWPRQAVPFALPRPWT